LLPTEEIVIVLLANGILYLISSSLTGCEARVKGHLWDSKRTSAHCP